MIQSNHNIFEGCTLCNIIDTAVSAGVFQVWSRLVAKSKWLQVLSSQQEDFTLFAPTDKAFATLPEDYIANLQAHSSMLDRFLGHFIVPRMALISGDDVRQVSVAGDDLLIRTVNDRGMVNSAKITFQNILATNGIIHGVDTIQIFNTQIASTSDGL
jgi:uncharacterized surface protein with fasciclin (FAS1) repeats